MRVRYLVTQRNGDDLLRLGFFFGRLGALGRGRWGGHVFGRLGAALGLAFGLGGKEEAKVVISEIKKKM